MATSISDVQDSIKPIIISALLLNIYNDVLIPKYYFSLKKNTFYNLLLLLNYTFLCFALLCFALLCLAPLCFALLFFASLRFALL